MNKQRKTSHILNVFQYDVDGHVVLPASLTLTVAPASNDNSGKVGTTAWVRSYVTGLSYLTGNQSISVSGDASGSGTTAISLTLANSGVTAGTYGSTTLVPVVTVDAKGRITSVTTASISGALTFTGDVTGTGTTGTSTGLTLANSGVTAGTYTKVTVDAKGRVTVGASATTSDISEGTNLYYTDARVLAYLGANNYATQSYVGTQIANLVSSAPATLDTLNELATALGNDPNFATTVSTSIGTKVPQTRTLTINGTTLDLSADRTFTIAAGVTSFNTRQGAITLSSSDVTGALGFTPYNATNPSGYISGITSANVTTALGYTPYNSTNPNGYITSAGSISGSAGSVAWTNVSGRPTALSSFTNDLGNYGGWITSSGNISGYAMSLNGYAGQTEYTILTGPANGPVIKVRYDGATANRYIDIGSKDGNGVYSEGLKIYNGGTLTFGGYTIYHSGNIPTWNQNTSGTAGSISGFNNPTTAATANTIVYRDGSGDIYGRYIFGSYHNSSDDISAGTITYIMAKFGDNYHRSATAAKVQAFLGLGSNAYNSTTIPTNNNQLTNGAGYITGYTETDTLSTVVGRGNTTGGNIISSANMYASIFYDYADNGYYLDPNGTSNLYRTNILNNYVGNAIYFGGGNNYFNWDGTRINSNVGIQSTSEMRSPLFRFNNSGNNAYLTGDAGWGARIQTDSGYILFGPANGSYAHIYTDRGQFYFNKDILINNVQVVVNSGTWGISISGNADTVDGYHLNQDVTIGASPTWTTGNFRGDINVGMWGNSSNVNMYDGDEGTRVIHCNSNRIGFLTQAGSWGAYCDDAGNWFANNLSGTNTGDQTNISGNAATATNVAWSGVTSKPSHIMYYQSFTLDANTMDVNATGFTYSVNAPYTGPIVRFSAGGSYDLWLNAAYGGSGNLIAFRTRNGDAGTFNPWREFITSGNIGSQTVASASNATTAGGLAVHGGTNNEANKIVRTDANGYIQAGWINSISGNMGFENRITRITCSTDQYMRFQTLEEFKVSIGLSGKNNYSRRIDYTADANYHIGSFGAIGVSTETVWHYGSGFFDVWAGGGTFPGSMTHIHGFNALHYSAGAGGNGYGWQMASQYDRPGEYWARNVSGGTFSSWRQFITSDNIGSQSVSYATTAGSANSVAWTNVSSRPTTTSAFTNDSGYITSGSSVVGLYSSGFGNGNFTWYQSPGGLQQYGGSWASFLISNHGAGVDYYNQTIIMPFWGPPQHMRKEGGTNRGPYTFFTTENYDPSNYGGNFTANGYIRVNANNNLYLDYNHGQSIVGIYSSYRYQGVYSMGDAYKLAIDGTTPGNLYGMSWSHPNAGGQASRLNDHGLMIMINGVTQAAISSNIWAAGDVTAFSDARVKDNIEVINNAVEKIQAIRGVTFTRNDMTDTTTRHAGVIAQEVLEVLPEVITKDANDHYSVAYGNLNALLIEAIKEQQGQIEELKRQINYLVENK
jgi:hypothetical protein